MRESRETLYVRLPAGGAPEAARVEVEYAFVAADGPRQPLVRRALLSRVLEQAAGRRLVAFAPIADLRLAAVQVPARQPAKVLQAAPYLLEEQLAEEVDTQHFAIGARQADGSHPVAVVTRGVLQGWLERLGSMGARPEAIFPDVLALPWDEGAPGWSALVEGEQCIVRSGPYSGFACALDDLGTYLQLADPQRAHALGLVVPGDAPGDYTRIDWPLRLLPGHRSALEALIAHQVPERSINLLQGEYSPRHDYQRLWAPWKVPAALAATLLLLLGGCYLAEILRTQAELDRLQDANLEHFHGLFPAESRVVNLEVQLDQQLAALRGGGERGVMPLLDILVGALQENQGFTLRGLQYREGALFLSLTAAELQSLETLRDWFARRPGSVLEVQSADSGAEGVAIRLKLSTV